MLTGIRSGGRDCVSERWATRTSAAEAEAAAAFGAEAARAAGRGGARAWVGA